jgi:DNA excision repair protein ERCC-4
MIIPDEQDGKKDFSAINNDKSFETNIINRRGTQKQDDDKNIVIVDIREFRSELPSLLHKRNIQIEPVTLEVGDYILTPDMCVERKSLNDLIESISNGRLYNQANSMCRYYKIPILLIEFDQNKPFILNVRFIYLSFSDVPCASYGV